MAVQKKKKERNGYQ